MKCRKLCDIVLSPCTLSDGFVGDCGHKFCQSCFRKENADLASSPTYSLNCPCCHAQVYANISSIDEAVLIGEAATMRTFIFPQFLQQRDIVLSSRDIIEMNNLVVEKLESALLMNPTNLTTLYSLFCACSHGRVFATDHSLDDSLLMFYTLKSFDYSLSLIDHPRVSGQYDFLRSEFCYELALIFRSYCNFSEALKYSKLAYEQCLRSSNHTNLSDYKDLYLWTRDAFAELPPLRFAVGDEVEFLHEQETGSEWLPARITELYYRKRDFDIRFSAPYRVQLLVDHSDSNDQQPVYIWVKADIDRYVRKPGVRSIAETRYQVRLDAKVDELAQVYCSKEFILGIYRTLAEDHEFVDMMQSIWQIEVSVHMLYLYRMLLMYRQPLVRTDSGYHVPSSEEVITDVKAFFSPSFLNRSRTLPATDENRQAMRLRAVILYSLRNPLIESPLAASYRAGILNGLDIQGRLLYSIWNYIAVLTPPGDAPTPTESYVDQLEGGSDFTVPSDISSAISRVSNFLGLTCMISETISSTKLGFFLNAWVGLHTCLENPDAGRACECSFVYFFVKFCLDRGIGVPKLALTLYDRMNMQLSREFIRCAIPTCELNRLDKSTGQVKFKKCSRCHAVIYCSRECQIAHYPEHKRLCKAHSTG